MAKREARGLRVRPSPADHLGVIIRLGVYRALPADLRGGVAGDDRGESPLEEGADKVDGRTHSHRNRATSTGWRKRRVHADGASGTEYVREV